MICIMGKYVLGVCDLVRLKMEERGGSVVEC